MRGGSFTGGLSPIAREIKYGGNPSTPSLSHSNIRLQINDFHHVHQRKFRSSNFRLYWKLPVALAASMFDSRDVLAGRNSVFFRSFVASKVRKGRSEKRGGAKDRLLKMSTKFAPRLRARAIWKSKSLKTGMPGALLEVDIDKICTTPARKNDSEVKIVKNWGFRRAFGSWASQNLHHACARERFGSQNR